MDKRAITIAAVVVLAVIVVGGLFFYLGSNTKDDTNNTDKAASGTSTDQKAAGDTTTPAQDSQTQESGNSDNTTADAEETSAVTIGDMAFAPKQVTVKVGATVTWTNQDSVQHSVKSDDGSADGPSSELLAKGQSYSFSFKKAGVYNYHCGPHPFMKGTVTVTE